MRDGFVFYRSFYEALKDLDAETYKAVTSAICEYALNEVEPELEGAAKSLFILIKPQIDANARRSEVGKANGEKGGQYGYLGGRPKKNPKKTPNKPLDNPQETAEKPPSINYKPPKEKDKEKEKDKYNKRKNAFCNYPQADTDIQELTNLVFIN